MATISRRKIAGHVVSRLLDGDKAAIVLKELAAYLVDSKRTKEADLIIRDIETTLANRGTVLAHVTSARSLESAAKQAIESYIASKSGAKTVTLTESIDETLLGGVKIEYPGHQLDATVKTKLERLTV